VGVTYACGTGSTASSYVGYRVGLLEKKVLVKNRGGDLKITIEPKL
jgi:diaminopimelate epimerase